MLVGMGVLGWWLQQLGLTWATLRVEVPGLGPTMPLADYFMVLPWGC